MNLTQTFTKSRRLLLAVASAIILIVSAASFATQAKASSPALGGAWGFMAGNLTYSPLLCMDDSYSYGLRMFACNSASNVNGYQKFIVLPDPYATGDANSYEIKNVNTGQCLDDSTAYGVRAFGCNKASYVNGYQKWQPFEWESTASSDYLVQWYNVATSSCLDYSFQYGLRGFGCNTSSFNNGYQDWYMFSQTTPPV